MWAVTGRFLWLRVFVLQLKSREIFVSGSNVIWVIFMAISERRLCKHCGVNKLRESKENGYYKLIDHKLYWFVFIWKLHCHWNARTSVNIFGLDNWKYTDHSCYPSKPTSKRMDYELFCHRAGRFKRSGAFHVCAMDSNMDFTREMAAWWCNL